MAEEVKTGDEVKKVEATATQSKTGSSDPMMNLLVIGIVCFVVGFFVADALNVNYFGATTTTTTKTIPGATTTTTAPATKVNMIFLNDARCPTCVAFQMSLSAQLRTLFPDVEVTIMDYSKPDGKALYDSTGVGVLPAVLFDDTVKSAENYAQVQAYLEQKGKYLSLRIGATFDPVCDNGNGTIDCSNTRCQGNWACMPKLDTPKVEVFVMSHCPYGTQIEKGILPVAYLLGDKLNFSVKFCSYAMHGKTEVDEEVRQYCIQKDFKGKYLAYLDCFLSAGKSDDCVKNVSIDAQTLSVCMNQTDAAYSITKKFNDESTWLGGSYPPFDIFKADNEKYGIQGSPGLVINGVVAEGVSRDSASLLKAVCRGFTNKPAECSKNLSSTAPTAGFGWSGTGSGSAGSCT
jgi:hypothetical protein